jgi:hypothetical protein
MRKDNMEQRSAEQFTTEELDHISGGGGQGVPPPTNYQVGGRLPSSGGDVGDSYPGGGRSSYAEKD